MLKTLLYCGHKSRHQLCMLNLQFTHDWLGKQIYPKADNMRKLSSYKKDDCSIPAQNSAKQYSENGFKHKEFKPPKCLPLTAFRKFRCPEELLGPDAGKTKDYKNPEYFSYHRFSFVTLQKASIELKMQKAKLQEEIKEHSGDVDDAAAADDDFECSAACKNECKAKEAEQAEKYKREAELLQKAADRYKKEECETKTQSTKQVKCEEPKVIENKKPTPCTNDKKKAEECLIMKQAECESKADKKKKDKMKKEIERLQKEAERYEQEQDCEETNPVQQKREAGKVKSESSKETRNVENNPAIISIAKKKSRTCDSQGKDEKNKK